MAAAVWLAGMTAATGEIRLITNVDGRSTVSLDGSWKAIVDPFDTGYYDYRYQPRGDGFFLDRKPRDKSDRVEYDFDRSGQLEVPGDWNSQREKLFFYEGSVWYRRKFSLESPPERRVFLRFGAANYRARAWLNGSFLGSHEGGFTPFEFEVTERLTAGENTLVVQVDNRRLREGVPTVNTDWWNYGGLTRSVTMMEVPETFIREYSVQLAPGRQDRVAGWVELDGAEPSQSVTVRFPDAGFHQTVVTDEQGRAEFEFAVDLDLWSPASPALHRVELSTAADRVVEQIGLRSITVRGDEIVLNGRPIFLRGISIHAEAPLRGGRAVGRNDAETLLGWARELGANFVRLAHYPHDEEMLRAADRLGLLVWSEIPVYWTIEWQNSRTLELALRQLEEMVRRDRNRASIAIWSVANETPRSPERLAFLGRLIERTRQLDPTRLVSAATELTWREGTLLIDDPLAEYLDVIGANEYVGWYGGTPEDASTLEWQTIFHKPLVVSEFGGGALAGFHGDEATRWTEEYQANLYRQQIAMLGKIPFLAGMSPWILADFRSPRRLLPGIQDYWNRKGLLSETGEKKQAFFVLQSFYRELATVSADSSTASR